MCLFELAEVFLTFFRAKIVSVGCKNMIAVAAWLALGVSSGVSAKQDSGQKYNVIHIIIDDLRPEIGAYGIEDSHTPNLDKCGIYNR